MLNVEIGTFSNSHEEAVLRLWASCGLLHPSNDPKKDIARKQKVNPDLFLIALIGGKVVGTLMAGYEGHRGWINYLAVDPARRKLGLGRKLMAEAELRLKALGCPKINLQVRQGNQEACAFYEKLGFGNEQVISFGKRLADDAGSE